MEWIIMENFIVKHKQFLFTSINGQKTHKIQSKIRRTLWGEILGTGRGQGNPWGRGIGPLKLVQDLHLKEVIIYKHKNTYCFKRHLSNITIFMWHDVICLEEWYRKTIMRMKHSNVYPGNCNLKYNVGSNSTNLGHKTFLDESKM